MSVLEIPVIIQDWNIISLLMFSPFLSFLRCISSLVSRSSALSYLLLWEPIITLDTKLTMALAGCSGSCSANKWQMLSMEVPVFLATKPKILKKQRGVVSTTLLPQIETCFHFFFYWLEIWKWLLWTYFAEGQPSFFHL